MSKTIFKPFKNKIDNKTLGSGSKLGQNSGSGSKLGQNSGSGSKFCVLGSTTLLKVVKERLGSGPRAYDVSGWHGDSHNICSGERKKHKQLSSEFSAK